MRIDPKQLSMQGAGLLARKGFIAIAFLAIGRMLGPKALGEYTYIYTWVYICALVSGMGLSPICTREIARELEQSGRILKATMAARVTFALVGILILNAVWIWWKFPLMYTLMIFSCWILPSAFLDQLGAFVMGFGRNGTFALINACFYACFAISTIVTVSRTSNLQTVVVMQVLWGIVSALLLLWLLRKEVVSLLHTAGPDMTLIRHLVRASLPLAITNVLGVLYFRIGTLQLFQIVGSTNTGLFVSSLQVLEALQILPMAVMGALFPKLCRDAKDTTALNSSFHRIIFSLFTAALFCAATGSALSGSMMRALYGNGFSESALLLKILIWAAVPTFLHFALAYFLIAADLQRYVTINALWGVVISFFCNWLLIPRIGPVGAVIASLVTETSICVLHFIVLVRKTCIRPSFQWLPVQLAVALIVTVFGGIWRTQINAGLLVSILFAIVSGLAFYSVLALEGRNYLRGERAG